MAFHDHSGDFVNEGPQRLAIVLRSVQSIVYHGFHVYIGGVLLLHLPGPQITPAMHFDRAMPVMYGPRHV